MKNCSGINCPMQYGVVDTATCPAVECCPNATPPLTNYDRIISETPEELADELLTAFAAFYDVEWSKEAVIDWLKQEATE